MRAEELIKKIENSSRPGTEPWEPNILRVYSQKSLMHSMVFQITCPPEAQCNFLACHRLFLGQLRNTTW